MIFFKVKYYLICFIFFVVCFANAQQSTMVNQAIVTIVGDDVEDNNINDFVNTNPYAEINAPQVQQKISNYNQNIEPTFENGFHMRFELESPQPIVYEHNSNLIFSERGINRRVKHSNFFIEFAFNFKQRVRSLLSEHKKTYRTNLCGHF